MNRLWKSDRSRSYDADQQIIGLGHTARLKRQAHINKFLFPLIFGSAGLILEYHIVVPAEKDALAHF
jgi:hypothetical protein